MQKYNSYRDVPVNLKKKYVSCTMEVEISQYEGFSKADLIKKIASIPDDAVCELTTDTDFYGGIDRICISAAWTRLETEEEFEKRKIADQKKKYGQYLRSIGEL